MYKRNKILRVLTMLPFISLSTLPLAALNDAPKIYKTVHADGSVSYSDQASSESEVVVLDVPTSTLPSSNHSLKLTAQKSSKQNTNYQLSILSPQAEATIRSNQGELTITAKIEPQSSGFFQLHINDNIQQSASGIFQLTEMHRGTYQYSVRFIDNSGKVIASTQKRNLYLHKASTLIN